MDESSTKEVPTSKKPLDSFLPVEDKEASIAEDLLDLDADPLVEQGEGPSHQRLDQVDQIRPRKLTAPEPETQAKAVKDILKAIESEPDEPGPTMIAETEKAIENLQECFPNAEQFVAGSFQAFLPAWQALLSGSKRASSRQVLTWLKHGFVPKFVGTTDAPERNKKAVSAMLKKVMTAEQAEKYLQAKYPGRVEFKSHRSFYDHWDFASGEVLNLFKVTAATLLPIGAKKPILVHPFGVADTASKQRLICDARALNIFLKNLPFQYEKL
jgi:hypothetical protein